MYENAKYENAKEESTEITAFYHRA